MRTNGKCNNSHIPSTGLNSILLSVTLCSWETPIKTSTFANSKDPDEMQHYAASGPTLFVMVKKIFRQKNTIFFENFNLTALDMYNGLSQVYYTKREGRTHLYAKG